MFEAFARSWEITKLSFRIIGKDKEILLFPLLSGVASLMFLIAMLFPTVLSDTINQGSVELGGMGPVDFMILFATYMGLAFVATFFNVCTVYTTKVRLEGGDATFGESLKFAAGRLQQILGWSFVSATVGVVLYTIDRLAEQAGVVGEIVIKIITGLIGAVWSVVTIFVVPVMIYEGIGPVDSVKASVKTLKKTWGESLVRHFGLGLIQFLFMLLGILIAVGLFTILGGMGTGGLIAALVLTIVYFLGVILVFAAANMVFNTVLYHYAAGHDVDLELVDPNLLNRAFRSRD